MSLRAPLAVPVEIRSEDGRGGVRRVFRLSANVGEDGVTLERPVPFDVGRPVAIAFTLPDAPAPTIVRAELALTDEDGSGEYGGSTLTFVAASSDVRLSLQRYVFERLSLPPF